MTSEKLTLSDGTELENSSAILSGNMFLYIRGEDMKTVFDLLIDPENTEEIVYTMINGEDLTFRGFNKLIAVTDEENGLITAVLRKEVSE
jgi:hypothetical protein